VQATTIERERSSEVAAAMAAVARPSQVSLPTIYLADPANCTALISIAR